MESPRPIVVSHPTQRLNAPDRADALTRVMVLNRLCDARSKLGVLRWLEGVWVPGLDSQHVTHQRLLRVMDVLEAHQATIMSRLAGLVRPLLDQDLSLVFYDLTTVRIHGEGDLGKAELRAHGLSKDTGGIARQFTLGLVQSGYGMPLDFEVFARNVGEVSTLLPIIERCVQRYRIQSVTLVADRGMLSIDQLDALKAMNLPDGVSLSWILAVQRDATTVRSWTRWWPCMRRASRTTPNPVCTSLRMRDITGDCP
jgi:transposase